MRIDEFSNATDIDGSISDEERVRFCTFGFDILSDEPTAEGVNNFLIQLSINPKEIMLPNRSPFFKHGVLFKVFNKGTLL